MTAQQQWLLAEEDDGLDAVERTTHGHDFYAMTTAEIAHELGCSERQVIADLQRIYRKIRRLAARDPEVHMVVRSWIGRVRR